MSPIPGASRGRACALGLVAGLCLLCSSFQPVFAQRDALPAASDTVPQDVVWGTPADGLQFGICSNDSVVRQGDVVVFHAVFRLDPTASPAEETAPPFARVAGRSTTFAFIDASGKDFPREEEQLHGPAIVGVDSDRTPLQPDTIRSGTCRVSLLTLEGEQLPAGSYLVRATYENRPRHRQKSSDKIEFWSGTLTSGTMRMHVAVAHPEEIEIRTNSQLRWCTTDQGSGYQWSEEDPVVLRAFRRPGYTIVYFCRVLAQGGDGPAEPIGGRISFHTWVSGESCQFRRTLSPGARVWAEVKIVESASRDGLPALSERVDHRVLYETTVPATRTDASDSSHRPPSGSGR